tara:strand:+ start:156 stop:338 length:183 start_codon:yes stop_codon:yes gene_type:complete
MNKQENKEHKTTPRTPSAEASQIKTAENTVSKEAEFGGRKNGPEPTRYGDWELKGKCVDF